MLSAKSGEPENCNRCRAYALAAYEARERLTGAIALDRKADALEEGTEAGHERFGKVLKNALDRYEAEANKSLR